LVRVDVFDDRGPGLLRLLWLRLRVRLVEADTFMGKKRGLIRDVPFLLLVEVFVSRLHPVGAPFSFWRLEHEDRVLRVSAYSPVMQKTDTYLVFIESLRSVGNLVGGFRGFRHIGASTVTGARCLVFSFLTVGNFLVKGLGRVGDLGGYPGSDRSAGASPIRSGLFGGRLEVLSSNLGIRRARAVVGTLLGLAGFWVITSGFLLTVGNFLVKELGRVGHLGSYPSSDRSAGARPIRSGLFGRRL
jgi:hypothetical protein